MFKKLVSNLPFSPSLVAQLRFYAQRLKKEQWMRRLGLIFTVFALVIQSFAVFSPPESANAYNASYDVCHISLTFPSTATVRSTLQGCWDNNTRGFQKLMQYFGITRADLGNVSHVLISTGAGYGNYLNWGHGPYAGMTKRDIPGVSDVDAFYTSPFSATYPSITVDYWAITSSTGNWVAFNWVCGNMLTKNVPAPPKNPRLQCNWTHAKKNDSNQITVTTGESVDFWTSGNVWDGATWTNYRYTYTGPTSGDTGWKYLSPSGDTGTIWSTTFNTPGKYTVGGWLQGSVAVTGNNSGNCLVTVTVNPVPSAKCDTITVDPIKGMADQTTFKFGLKGTVTGGATWTGYKYDWSGAATGSSGWKTGDTAWSTTFKTPGAYTIQGYLRSTAGDNLTAATCKTSITVDAQKPAQDLEKLVNGVKENTVKPGETVTYTLKFTNLGNVALNNVVVKDTKPTNDGIIVNDSSLKITGATATNALTSLWSGGVIVKSVPVGGSFTISFTAKIPEAAKLPKCGTDYVFNNKATSTSNEAPTESNTNNNSTRTTTQYECIVPKYDLEKTVDKATANPGETITYTLTFTNTGNAVLNNVVVKDVKPTNDGITIDDSTITIDGAVATNALNKLWTDGIIVKSVPIKGSFKITFKAKLPAANKLTKCDTTYTYKNHAGAVTNETSTETNTKNNDAITTTKRACVPKYDLEKIVDKKTANAGDTLKYTIKVYNQGETDLTSVVVKDTLPDKVDPSTAKVTANGAKIEASADKKIHTITIPKIAKGETYEITITVKVAAKGNNVETQINCGPNKLHNVATVTAKNGTTTVEETDVKPNTADTDVDRVCDPGYDVIKKVDKDTASAGDILTYSILVKNTGEAAVKDLKIEDILPAQIDDLVKDSVKVDDENVTLAFSTKNESCTSLAGKVECLGTPIAVDEQGNSIETPYKPSLSASTKKLDVDKEFTITFQVKVVANENLVCGLNTLENLVKSSNSNNRNEDRTDNNTATTTVNKPCNCDDEEFRNDNPVDCGPILTFVKTAINVTQGGVDATTVKANGGDVIVYTITVSNNGKTAGATSIEDPLSDVLEYADLTDNGGGEYNDAAKTLNWNGVAVEPGQQTVLSFTVTVKNPIPSMAQGQSQPFSYDCIMANSINVNGRPVSAINTQVNCPPQKTVERVVEQLPRTGAGTNIIVGGVIAAVVVFFYARSRQLGKEVRLVRREFNTGTL
jgi:uncharacterized repeat protein (TIGR01451 family)